MDKRGQFTFYRSFWEAIQGLPKKDKLPILEAVISYALDGVVPSGLTKSQSAFFLLVKPNLDSSRKKAANGKQGGSKPKAKSKQAPSEKENEEEIEIEIENEIEGEKEKKQSTPAPGNSFTTFWEGYPSKIGREKAWEAWKELNPSAVMVSGIMNALEAWKRSERWLEDGGRFIPRAAKWLSEKHFECPPVPGKQKMPMGASGVLSESDIENIRRTMHDRTETVSEVEDL